LVMLYVSLISQYTLGEEIRYEYGVDTEPWRSKNKWIYVGGRWESDLALSALSDSSSLVVQPEDTSIGTNTSDCSSSPEDAEHAEDVEDAENQGIMWGEHEREQMWHDFGNQLRADVPIMLADVANVYHNYPLARQWSEVNAKFNDQRKSIRRAFYKGTPWPQGFIPKNT
jgi:hypothetical protein